MARTFGVFLLVWWAVAIVLVVINKATLKEKISIARTFFRAFVTASMAVGLLFVLVQLF
jgi:hypothetical protein